MTVKELVALLNTQDGGRLVVLAKDEEGNGFSPLAEAATGAYRAESTYHGRVGLERLTEADRADGYDECDVVAGGVPALVLWPTN